MITWLPYPDFLESIGALEMSDLNHQRADVIKILDVIHQNGSRWSGWVDHPAVSMWRGHEVTLCEYGLLCCEETSARGATNGNHKGKIEIHMDWATSGRYTLEKPSWFGEPTFHIAHQSNLIRRNPPAYGVKFSGVPMDLPYVWPTP